MICFCSVALPRGVMARSAVCDIGISLIYSLAHLNAVYSFLYRITDLWTCFRMTYTELVATELSFGSEI